LSIEHARDVAAGTSQALDVTARNRIILHGEYDDRNAAARTNDRLQRNFGAGGDDQVHLQPHQFGSDGEGSAGIVDPPIVDDDILALTESELTQLG
jgi:hypothetical protein